VACCCEWGDKPSGSCAAELVDVLSILYRSGRMTVFMVYNVHPSLCLSVTYFQQASQMSRL
jgi:hypothetical protein